MMKGKQVGQRHFPLKNVISQRQSRIFKSEIVGAQRDYSFTVPEQKILTTQYPARVLQNMSHVQSVVLQLARLL